MGEPCKIIPFRPILMQDRDERTYTEEGVKRVLYGFARDLERVRDIKPWRSDKLRKFIESAFDF